MEDNHICFFTMERNNLMDILLQTVFVIVETFAFINLSQAFCEKRDLSNKIRAICLSVFIILCLLIVYYLQTYLIVKIVLLIIVQYIFLIVYYDAKWYKSIGISFLFYVIVFALDFGTSFIIRTFGYFSEAEWQLNETLFVIASIISKFSLFTISYFIKNIHIKRLRNVRESRKEWVEISTFLFSNLVSLYLIFEMSLLTGMYTEWLIIISIFIVIGTIAVCEVTISLAQARFKEKQLEKLQQQAQIEMQNVAFTMELYNNERKITHDFNNHLLIINHLVNNNQNEKASTYINNLIGNQNISSATFNTGNVVIDALLTQKYSKIVELEINTKFILGDLSNLLMRNEDIVVLLSNLFDNAIEATNKCSGDRAIYLKLTKENDLIVLSLQNTTVLPPTKDFIVNKTTKKNKVRHGYGLQNIKYVLHQYNCEYSIVIENGWFKFVTLIM